MDTNINKLTKTQRIMTVIKSNGKRYISELPEFKEGLPFGILAKKSTDVGGSFCALSAPCNYIIVAPFKDLVDSISNDKNAPYKVLGVYGGVTYNDVKDYLLSNKVHKLAVTFDTLPKLISWIDKTGINSSEYKLLVDEFHLLLEDMGFRDKAIHNLMQNVKHFKHYTFMSATPIRDEFLISMFKELPYTEIEWDNSRVIKPRRVKTPNVYKSSIKLINKFLKEDLIIEDYNGKPTKVEELYIFLNSVKSIKVLLESAKLNQEDVKIICADSLQNRATLGSYEIGKISDANAKINLFTKKCFQGCNLFSNNGLTVVISDGQKANTLIDVETTLYQIAGRLRINEEFNNAFKHTIWHIYSNRRSVQSIDEFNEHLQKNIAEAKVVINTFNGFDTETKVVYSKRMDIDDLVCYYDVEEDKYIYSELKEMYFRNNYKVVNEIYTNGITVRDAYIQAGFTPGNQIWDNDLAGVVLASVVTTGFQELFNQYADLYEAPHTLTNGVLIREISEANPLIAEAYTKLGRKGVKTANYNEKAIKERIYSKGADLLEVVYTHFYKNVGDNTFISTQDAKELLKDIFKLFKITTVSPTVSLLGRCKWFKVEKAKTTINSVRVNGIKLIKY